jgi:tetratricopeptide (TPR) repeat protein
MEFAVSTGMLDFEGVSWTLLRDTIVELARANDIEGAAHLIEQADEERSMSDADLLISKIHMLSDRDSSQAVSRKKLVNELSAHLTVDGMAFVGSQIFFPSKQFQASAMLLERAAAAEPKDIAVKNNLALTYAVMGRFHDAEHLADQVMQLPRQELTDFGWSVVHKTKGYVYQARGQFEQAAQLLQRAVEESANSSDPNLRRRYLLNLARLRDLSRFENALAYCSKHPGDGFLDSAQYVDALHAYLLSALDRRPEALEIIEKWRKNPDVQRQILEYWSETPGAEPVIFKWKELNF